MKCRHCRAELECTFIDLGHPPPSNAYLCSPDAFGQEKHYPLKVLVCGFCWLVQTQDHVRTEELFADDYAYFSSFSSSWLSHARDFVSKVVKELKLDDHSQVVEIAANDGYLLQYVKQHDIPCFGIEPTRGTANAARQKGLEIIEEFFGTELAGRLVKAQRQADLVVANNVLAHVPDINDFVRGVSMLLKSDGVATFEFPHLLNLVLEGQFDTIYHEHYSYLSLSAVQRVLQAVNLSILNVEQLPTHGGSLRVYAGRAGCSAPIQAGRAVAELLEQERRAGVESFDFYTAFQARADRISSEFRSFLAEAKIKGRKVAAYGAAAKGNTLLNHAGVDSSLISFVADRNPAKQGKFMPGSHIPIVDENELKAAKPDVVILLPWNLKSELMTQLEYVRDWGGKFLTAIPQLEVL